MLQEMLKAEMSKDKVHRKRRRCCQASPWCGSYPGVSFPPSSVVFITRSQEEKTELSLCESQVFTGIVPSDEFWSPLQGAVR